MQLTKIYNRRCFFNIRVQFFKRLNLMFSRTGTTKSKMVRGGNEIQGEGREV